MANYGQRHDDLLSLLNLDVSIIVTKSCAYFLFVKCYLLWAQQSNGNRSGVCAGRPLPRLGSSCAVTGGRDNKPADVPVVLGQIALAATLEGEPLGPLLLSETEASMKHKKQGLLVVAK